MMSNTTRLLILVLPIQFSAIFAEFPGFGNSDNSGATAMQFLKLPAGARALAMGGRAITTESDATVAYWNPAGLADSHEFQYAFSHAEVLGEFRHEYLATVLPQKKAGSLALSANMVGGIFEGKDLAEADIDVIHLDMALGTAYGKKWFGGRIGTGARLDILRSQILDVSAWGYSITLGGLYHFPKDFKLGLTVHNLSHGVRYNTNTAESEPIPQIASCEFGKAPGLSPWSWHIGASAHDANYLIYSGLERKVKETFMLRTGYEKTLITRELGVMSGLSAGVGIRHKGFSVDAGFKLLAPLGSVVAVTLGYSKNSGSYFTEMELLNKAKAAFNKRQMEKAQLYTNRILKINHTNLEAVALLSRIKKELRRWNERAISLFYSANTVGHIVPQFEGRESMGGLVQRQFIIKELIRQYPHSLVLDAGNLSPTPTSPQLSHRVYSCYQATNYHGINLTPSELQSEVPAQDIVKMSTQLPWITSNLQLTSGKNLFPAIKKVKLKNGIHAGILGISASPDVIQRSPLRVKTTNPSSAVARLMAKEETELDLWIVLFDGPIKSANLLARNVRGIHVIILSGETRRLETPMINGKTILLSAGIGTKRLGHLSLHFDKTNAITNFTHEFITLNKPITGSDETRMPLTLEMGKNKKTKKAAPMREYESPFVAFVHSNSAMRAGVIYLKDTRTNLNYRITDKHSECYKPKASLARKRLAFICNDTQGQETLYSQGINSPTRIKITLPGEQTGDFEWGPNQFWLYFISESEQSRDLYKTDVTGTERINITKGRYGKIGKFNISPDGKKLAFQTLQPEGGQLWITNLSSVDPIRITKSGINGTMPKWSPDGSRLAFLRQSHHQEFQDLIVWDFRLNRPIVVARDNNLQEFCWTEKGDNLIFAAGRNLMDLNLFNIENKTQKKLEVKNPSTAVRQELSPRIYRRLGKDGLLFESITEKSADIYWMDFSTLQETKLIHMPGYSYLH